MEFVQFHPTGMVWPPGVRGLLVTEAVRGEGGILRNKDGERFMWKYLPEDRRHEYAATDDEAARLGRCALGAGRTTDARRPPELSTRDNVARAIYTEVKEGRGSPHGGVFLDISYLPAEHVRRKLPSMYEQFKELADVDITSGPMEVGPTTHYIMGGIRVDAETGATTRAGLFAAGEVAGRDARREPARRQLAVGPARVRPADRGGGGGRGRDARRGPAGRPGPDPGRARRAGRAVRPGPGRGSRTGSTRSSGRRCSRSSGSSGPRPTSTRRSAGWPGSTPAGPAIRVGGGRAYNPGWGLVFELRNMLIVSEAIARSARQRKESRGAHSRLDFPDLDKAWATKNSVVRRDGETMKVDHSPLPPLPDELRQLIATE